MEMGQDFQDLEIWQKAHRLRIEIYNLTKTYPRDAYYLRDQTNRAAHSAATNIAEGHGIFHYQQNIEHLRRARGSSEETRDDLIAARDMNLISKGIQSKYDFEYNELNKGINGYIRFLEKQKNLN